MIQDFEGSAYQELIAYMSEGNDAEVEQKVRNILTGFKETSGLDKGQFFWRMCSQMGGRSGEKGKGHRSKDRL